MDKNTKKDYRYSKNKQGEGEDKLTVRIHAVGGFLERNCFENSARTECIQTKQTSV